MLALHIMSDFSFNPAPFSVNDFCCFKEYLANRELEKRTDSSMSYRSTPIAGFGHLSNARERCSVVSSKCDLQLIVASFLLTKTGQSVAVRLQASEVPSEFASVGLFFLSSPSSLKCSPELLIKNMRIQGTWQELEESPPAGWPAAQTSAGGLLETQGHRPTLHTACVTCVNISGADTPQI